MNLTGWSRDISKKLTNPNFLLTEPIIFCTSANFGKTEVMRQAYFEAIKNSTTERFVQDGLSAVKNIEEVILSAAKKRSC